MANRNSSLEDLSRLCDLFGIVFGLLAPLCIIWGPSHFHTGRSSLAERVWVMLWYSVGCVAGLSITLNKRILQRFRFFSSLGMIGGFGPIDLSLYLHLSIAMGYGVLGVGPMVVVGQMIKQYGDCTRF